MATETQPRNADGEFAKKKSGRNGGGTGGSLFNWNGTTTGALLSAAVAGTSAAS